MRAVDTNVIVRLMARDDLRQVEIAEKFIVGGAWVSLLVLAEAMWVLSSTYDRDSTDISNFVEMLMHHEHFVLQDPDLVAAALRAFRSKPSVGFTDYLVLELARRTGHLPLGTFDRNLGKLEGTERL
jgi:predicted nucleic-acid-binding protein